jgi:hypothetical protein
VNTSCSRTVAVVEVNSIAAVVVAVVLFNTTTWALQAISETTSNALTMTRLLYMLAGTYGAFANRDYKNGAVIMAYCGYMHTEQGFLEARSAILDRLKREGYTTKIEREEAIKCGM